MLRSVSPQSGRGPAIVRSGQSRPSAGIVGSAMIRPLPQAMAGGSASVAGAHAHPGHRESETSERGRATSDTLLLQLHVQTKAANLVGQDVEAGGGARFEGVLALDHRLVDLGPPLHV